MQAMGRRQGAGRRAEDVVVASGSPALDGVNEAFHQAYDDVRSRAELDAPVLVVLSDILIVVHGEARRELPITPPLFHVVKSVAHAPVALHALLHREVDSDTALDARTEAALVAFEERLARATREVTGDASAAADGAEPRSLGRIAEDMRAVLAATSSVGATVRKTKRVERAELARFAEEVGPALLRLTEDATRRQLDALHARVEEAVRPMSAEERGLLEVVVTGAHQARARSFAMQYFQARLGEKEGVEERVTYGEGVETEAEAIALIGTRRLDRAIARAFFGDPHRLQRDVLGDAAAHVLRAMKLEPLR